jgi:hypothetical protein
VQGLQGRRAAVCDKHSIRHGHHIIRISFHL